MSLEAKKWNVVQLIASISNEAILDEISARIVQLIPEQTTSDDDALLAKYSGSIEDKLDISKILQEQNYTGIDFEKMAQLAKDANIEEPIDELLEILD